MGENGNRLSSFDLQNAIDRIIDTGSKRLCTLSTVGMCVTEIGEPLLVPFSKLLSQKAVGLALPESRIDLAERLVGNDRPPCESAVGAAVCIARERSLE